MEFLGAKSWNSWSLTEGHPSSPSIAETWPHKPNAQAECEEIFTTFKSVKDH